MQPNLVVLCVVLFLTEDFAQQRPQTSLTERLRSRDYAFKAKSSSVGKEPELKVKQQLSRIDYSTL